MAGDADNLSMRWREMFIDRLDGLVALFLIANRDHLWRDFIVQASSPLPLPSARLIGYDQGNVSIELIHNDDLLTKSIRRLMPDHWLARLMNEVDKVDTKTDDIKTEIDNALREGDPAKRYAHLANCERLVADAFQDEAKSKAWKRQIKLLRDFDFGISDHLVHVDIPIPHIPGDYQPLRSRFYLAVTSFADSAGWMSDLKLVLVFSPFAGLDGKGAALCRQLAEAEGKIPLCIIPYVKVDDRHYTLDPMVVIPPVSIGPVLRAGLQEAVRYHDSLPQPALYYLADPDMDTLGTSAYHLLVRSYRRVYRDMQARISSVHVKRYTDIAETEGLRFADQAHAQGTDESYNLQVGQQGMAKGV